jgi:ribonuclease HI
MDRWITIKKTMGTGITIRDENKTTIKGIICTPPEGNTSSTRPELWGILRALNAINPIRKIEIKTDSQASIDSINNITNENKYTTIRQIMKRENYDILVAIKEKFNQYIS